MTEISPPVQVDTKIALLEANKKKTSYFFIGAVFGNILIIVISVIILIFIFFIMYLKRRSFNSRVASCKYEYSQRSKTCKNTSCATFETRQQEDHSLCAASTPSKADVKQFCNESTAGADASVEVPGHT